MTTRTSTNFWLDLVSLVVMLGLVGTGGLMHFVLPPGTGHSLALLGLGRHDFGEMHWYLAIAAVVLLVVHLLLHWSWVCGVVGKAVGSSAPSRRAQTTWGLSLLFGVVVLLGGGLWWASSVTRQTATPRRSGAPLDDTLLRQAPSALESNGQTAEPPQSTEVSERTATPFPTPARAGRDGAHQKHLEDCPAGASINGRTSLIEAARKCSVSIEQMTEHLNLPAGIDHQEQLGRLKRRYGLEIDEVRRYACR